MSSTETRAHFAILAGTRAEADQCEEGLYVENRAHALGQTFSGLRIVGTFAAREDWAEVLQAVIRGVDRFLFLQRRRGLSR